MGTHVLQRYRYWTTDGADAELQECTVETLKMRLNAAAAAQNTELQRKCVTDSRNISNAMRLFKNLPDIRKGIHEFNADPWELNVVNGVIDLRTGSLRKRKRGELFTYCLDVEFKPDADTTVITDQHDATVLNHASDENVRRFMQMAMGYTLTGDTSQECMFYLWGPNGRNGKGTLLSAMEELLMGSGLADSKNVEEFTSDRNDPQGFSMAGLDRTRLIVSSESEESQRLSAPLIKRLTGGDMINACYKHQKGYQFRPQFKIWLMSNFKPKANPDDTAFWGRLRLIVFPNSFYGNEDPSIKDRAKEKWCKQALLKYMVDGAAMFHNSNRKLQTPQVFIDALAEARNDNDGVARWLDETEHRGDPDTDWMEAKATYEDYKIWCDDNDEHPIGVRKFRTSLETKGYPKKRMRVTNSVGTPKNDWVYVGIKGDWTTA